MHRWCHLWVAFSLLLSPCSFLTKPNQTASYLLQENVWTINVNYTGLRIVQLIYLKMVSKFEKQIFDNYWGFNLILILPLFMTLNSKSVSKIGENVRKLGCTKTWITPSFSNTFCFGKTFLRLNYVVSFELQFCSHNLL